MFLGHFGVALAAKRVAPQASLGGLFLAAQLIDLAWPTLLLLGLERVAITPGATAVTPLTFLHYPWTHSLLGVAGWALLAAVVVLLCRAGTRLALLVAALVLSHWLLDLLTHAPDLLLWPGGTQAYGLGLWGSLPGTMAVEGAIFAAGLWAYRAATGGRPPGRSLSVLLALLVVIWLANLFGTPPPDVATLAWVGQSQWLLVFWAWRADRPRGAVAG